MSRNILIVDDSATARALFKVCMGDDSGYNIIESGQWQDAVKKAESENPFLIILDYNMPEKSGSELAKIMQDKGIKAHYILMSANTQDAVVDEVKALGFADVIEKPVSVEVIQAMLEKLS